MPAYVAVLDANVLIPASLRDLLLRAAAIEIYRPHWSAQILEEVRRNLVKQLGVSEERARRIVALMDLAFPEAAVDGYEPLVAAMTNDPKDRHVLAAAVVAGAELIVTSNLRDFPRVALDPYHITAESPDAFLLRLYEEDAARLWRALQDQAADLRRPPRTVAELLRILARTAPEFAVRLSAEGER